MSGLDRDVPLGLAWMIGGPRGVLTVIGLRLAVIFRRFGPVPR